MFILVIKIVLFCLLIFSVSRCLFSGWVFLISDCQLELRTLLLRGTLTIEEVYKDRDQFAGLVREVAAPDVGRMGVEILSFTIKDVYDDVQYLASLGESQTAVVKQKADI